MTDKPPNVPVHAVETTLEIIKQLQVRDGAGVSTLASELGVAKSTVHNHLRTLERHTYVVQRGDEFYLSFRFLDLGGYVRARDPAFRLIRSKVQELAQKTGELCHFYINEGSIATVVFMERGEQAVETRTRVGTRIPLTQPAAGRVLIAVNDMDITQNSREDGEALEKNGYLATNEEYIKGLRAIAVPVTKANTDVIGALSVAGPAHRLQDEQREHEIADQMLDVSNELELNVSYSRY